MSKFAPIVERYVPGNLPMRRPRHVTPARRLRLLVRCAPSRRPRPPGKVSTAAGVRWVYPMALDSIWALRRRAIRETFRGVGHKRRRARQTWSGGFG